MKKTVISLMLGSLFIGNLSASSNSNEDILNNVLTQLMQDNKKENKPISNVVLKQPEVKKEVLNNIPQKVFVNQEVVKKGIDNEIVKQEIVEQPALRIIDTSSVLDNNTLDNNLMNEDLTIQDIHSAEKEMNMEQNQDHMFLLNVPVDTEIRTTIDLILPPYRDKINYFEGKLVSENPFNHSKEVTYCYLELEKSGIWRRFKSSEDKYLKITSNVSNKIKYEFSQEGENEVITVYETVFSTDNPHIKQLVCETSKKQLPLTIGDLNKATGGLFKFTYTPMVDI
jgi:hypothetical protein